MYYKYTEEKIYNPQIGWYQAFAIEAIELSTGITLKKVSDLFLSRDEAASFADKLNKCKAELIHFEELCTSAIE